MVEIFHFFNSQDFDERIKTNGFSIELCSTGVKFSFEISNNELKPVVVEKNLFEE